MKKSTIKKSQFLIKFDKPKFCKMQSEVIIGNEKYIILPNEEYKSLKGKASPNLNGKTRLTIDEAEAYSIELINKWAKEKSQFNWR